MTDMNALDQYDFVLPEKLIAQLPAHPRDHARLLVYERASGALHDDHFYNLERYLHPKTTLVLNNSKVEKARLRFNGLEVFITNQLDGQTVEAMVRPGKRFQSGQKLELVTGIYASVEEVLTDGQRRLRFNVPLDDERLTPFKKTPFPPYIVADEQLASEYQTVYAKPLGSKAAPTAGLHFTPELLETIKNNHSVAEVTLHVGLGTFAPLRKYQLESGKLHEELFSIDKTAADTMNQAGHLTAVGTTAARVLESAASEHGKFEAMSATTDIFIRPGYTFKAVDSLITNFHLPKSSLLMLIAAMTDLDEMQRIYRHAIENEYRFYSFGDAMMIV